MIIDTNSFPKINRIAMRYGNLEVIDFFGYYRSGKKSTRPQWLCVCDCGNLTIKSSTDLNGRQISKCKGCAYASRKQSKKRINGWQRLFNLTVKARSKNKKIPVSLTVADFQKISSQNCHYCGTPPKLKTYLYTNNIYAIGSEIYANGLDRIDNSKGYHLNNVVACCFTCNRAKGTMSFLNFMNWIARLAAYNRSENASSKR